MFSVQDLARLESERNLWLATLHPDGKPHLVPIWFVWLADKVYLCTSKTSVKARNISRNPDVVFALQDGDDPVVVHASAKILPEPPEAVISEFIKKFNWDIRSDQTYNAVIEITPVRVVL